MATRAQYGSAYRQNLQIGALAMHDAGYRGEGMQIAVFDAGFPGVDRISALQPLVQENRAAEHPQLRGWRHQRVHAQQPRYQLPVGHRGQSVGPVHRHGAQGHFHLCITEDIASEHPIEEANWLAAAEYADSSGVDVISSSLGYTDFDAPSPSYTYADMNGRTAISSRAAAVAARVGMVVVSAAGNEGNNPWHYISAPADADSIISVGAVDSLGRSCLFQLLRPTPATGASSPRLSAMGLAAAVLAPNGAPFPGQWHLVCLPHSGGHGGRVSGRPILRSRPSR